MRSEWVFVAALLLAGCVSLRGPGEPESQLAPLLQEATLAVRAVATAVDAGNGDGFAEAKDALERARIVAVAEAVSSPREEPHGLASYAALAVTLGLCREGLDRAAQKLTADPASGPGLATAIRLGCVAPLLLFAAN